MATRTGRRNVLSKSRVSAGSAVALSLALCVQAGPAAAQDRGVRECIAANEAAQDLRQAGRLREARQKLALCVSATCPGPVRSDCARRLAEVDAATPSLVFEVRDEAGNDLSAVRITSDGQLLAERLDGTPITTDPGEHRFAFESPGMTPADKTIVVREGDKGRHERITLHSLSTTSVAAVPLGASEPAAATVSTAARPEATTATPDQIGSGDVERGSGSRSGGSPRVPPLAFVAFGVGAAGLAVGIVAGLAGESKHAALEGECAANGDCPVSAQGDLDAFHSLKTASTVGYVLGFAAVAGGVVLWFTTPNARPHGASARLWIGPRLAGLSGTF
jgi:hypothetical protein